MPEELTQKLLIFQNRYCSAVKLTKGKHSLDSQRTSIHFNFQHNVHLANQSINVPLGLWVCATCV